MTRDLNIRADIDSKGARQGARETNKAQDEIARKAREVGREQAKQQSGLVQQMKSREREQKKLERSLDSLERKASLHGKRGLERIRAQEIAMKAQARAAGATADQIKRIGDAYDQMAARAVAAQRRTQAAQARRGGGAGSTLTLGALAARGSAIAAGAIAAVGGGGAVGGLIDRSARLSDLPAALGQVANNSGVVESRLRGVVQELHDLDFSMIQAQKSTALLAQTGIPELLARVGELGRAARNFSVISGNPFGEVFEGLVGGIVKEEVEILETQGLLLKFQTGYEKYAASIGKAVNQLTEEEKAISRLIQVLEKATAVQGVYERSLNTSGGALRSLTAEAGKAYDAVALLADPGITAGARALGEAFGGVSAAIRAINDQRIDGESTFGTILKMGAREIGIRTPGAAFDFAGAFTPEQFFKAFGRLAFGADKFVGPSRALAGDLDFVGPPRSLITSPGSRIDPAPTGKPEPRGYYSFSELTLRDMDLARLREGAVGVGSQLAAAGNLTAFGPAGPPVSLTPGGAVGLGGLGIGSTRSGGLALDRDTVADRLKGLEEWNQARQNQIKDEQQAITRANEQLFRDIKFQSASLFQAMVGGGQQFWNFFRNAGLTVMSEIFSNSVAGMLTGGRGGGGVSGALGGLLGGGGLGSIGRPGAPGGTSGFAGPVAAAGTAAAGRSGGLLGGLRLGSGAAALGLVGAVGVSQLPGRGAAAGAVKGGAAAGLGFGGALAAFPALAGLLGVPGVNVGLGVAIGVGALVGKLTSGARGKARQKVREVYGVTVRDGGILDQIVAAGRDFGSLAVAVQSPGIRDLVQLYAMSTGQDPRGGVTAQMASAVRLRQVGGLLFQDVQYSNGRPTAAPSALPLLGVGRNAAVNVVNLDPMATAAALENAAYRAIAGSGELVQAVGARAMRQSAGRRTQAALLMEPMTAVGS